MPLRPRQPITVTRKAQVERFVHGAGLPRGLLLTLVAGAFFAGLAAPARSTASDSSTARGNVTTDPGGDRRFEAVRSLLRDGRYFAAESTSRVLVDEARSAPGADSVSFARAADVLVESSWRLGRGNRGEIRDLAAAAVRIKERTLGASAPELAVSLGNLAAVHFTTSEIRSARPLYRRALLIRQQALGDESPLTATLMASYARTVADSSQITALPLYERAVQICRRVLPPDDPDLARVISQLAWIHRVMGNLQESRPLFEEALKLQERILPARHPDLAYTLYHYGYLLVMSGDRLEAKAACERSLAIREASLGPDHPDFAWSLNDIANILTYQGDFSTATRYLERALAIFERNTGNNAGSASTARMNLAKVYLFRADFTESRRLYDQALAAKERAFGREHPEVTQVLSSYAGMLVNSGDVEGAKTLLERAWSICRQALLPTDPRSLNVEMTLAVAVGALGDHARADTLFRHAIAVREQAQGRDATGLSTPLTNFGIDRYVAGDYEGARRLLLRSDSIAVKQGVYGDYNAGFTGLLVGHIEFALGHLGESERHLRSAIDAWTRFYGDQQQDVASARVSLGEVLWERGDRTRALEAALVAEAALREHVRLTMRGLSERQALGYATSLGGGRDLALAVGADGLGPSDARRVWDAVIRGRALVLDEVAERHRRAADVSRQALALASASERLANLTVRGPGNDDPDLYRQMLDQAREQRERAERALSESSGEFRRERAQRDAGAAEVIDALPDQSAIVSYVSFVRRARRPGALASISEGRGPPPESLFTATPSYIAFVLRRGETEPGVVPLGSGAAVDSLVAHWSFQVSRGARVKSRWLKEESYRPAGEALRAAVWDPVAHHLRGIERVYIVADGALNLVNFGTLPVDDSRYLIETGPSLHLLSAERDLIRREEGVSGSGLLAIGGPDFDRAAETRDEPMADASVTSSSGSAPSLRGRLSHCGDLANQRWDPLPGTLTEARAVTDLWITSGAAEAAGTRKNSFLLTGARADETSFKRLAPHRRVLHVATHGFFAGAACASPSSLPRILSSNLSGNAMPAAENPLLLCGLTLAGANHHGGSGAAGDDGILTAEEVSALDLGGVEWAVLSACETGVGQVRAGEGVFGLRRAFQVAGAHTVIMSLWAVEDQATLKWMEALYAARLRQHRSTAESVREASLAVLRERRARHENTHPFYWGAFVAAGDWR